jgi:RNA polymerase sigma-70 factor (ECF subfamily)
VATLSLCDPHTSLAPEENSAAADVHPLLKSTIDDDFDVLVSAAVDGERAAVEAVLRRIRPLVVRYCRTRVGGQEKTFASADDVAQDVCLAVLTALPSYRDQGRPFLAFVYGIAAHKVADAHRSSARNRSDPVPDVPDAAELVDGPEAQLIQVELAERMAKLLDILPAKQRDILVLRVVMGLSAEQTAEVVGSTPGAVRVAQHRALNRLRTVLASRNRSEYGVRARVRSTAVTSKITEHLECLTEWMAEGLRHGQITALTAGEVAL